MIKTEFQKLVRSIHRNIIDDHFLESLGVILKSGFADIPSVMAKLRDIHNNLGSLDNACDKATEIKAASKFCIISGLNCISFGENPDVRIRVDSLTLSIEVKRFRFRPKDATDSVALKNYKNYGRLVPYGTSKEVQTQIEDVLLEKVKNYIGTEPFFVYLWSDSLHQVEDSEIKSAARAIRSRSSGKFLGVFYKWAHYERNIILLESNVLTDEIESLLRNKFFVFR